MIEEVEAVMRHWGEAVRGGCPSGGLASPAGTLVEWLGCVPRGGAGGSRMLLAGAGPDFLASEVQAALGVVAGMEGGDLLRLLASRRYTFEPALSVDDQVRDLDLGRGDAGRRAYTRLVERLHQLVQAELTTRQAERKARVRKAQREGDRVRRVSALQAAQAHSNRGTELYQGARDDRSSGDSAPVGAAAPRQAHARTTVK